MILRVLRLSTGPLKLIIIGSALVCSLALADLVDNNWTPLTAPEKSGCERKAPDFGLEVKADLDGDGHEDVAKWEKSKNGKTARLAVWLNGAAKPMVAKELKAPFGDIFIQLVSPAEMETWCGKTGECSDGKEKKINVKRTSLGFGVCESSFAVLLWDATEKRFNEHWISD